MDLHTRLLLKNHSWSAQMKLQDPEFFKRQAQGQQPKVLWIGCSDSRTPAEVIVDSNPGDIFMHRNIAAQVIPNDPSMLSVVQFAVDYLKIDDIIVCGHYKCGGIEAAVKNIGEDHLGDWLGNIRAIYARNREKFPNALETQQMFDAFVDLVVVEQIKALSRVKTITDAWEAKRNLRLHGWVYRLSEGLATELITVTEPVNSDTVLSVRDDHLVHAATGAPESVSI